LIAYLKGTIIEKGLTYIILENQGIGYKVFGDAGDAGIKGGGSAALYTYMKGQR